MHIPKVHAAHLFNKQMVMMLLFLGIVFGIIFGIIFLKKMMMHKYLSVGPPPISVSTLQAEYQDWQPELKAAGSVISVLGVDVTTEITGLVREINFVQGAVVKKDDVLLSLNDDTEVATLHALQASAELAKTVYERDKAQFAVSAVSKATLDFDAADLKNKEAQALAQAAIVQKKKILAPFDGRLGISPVKPGQFLNPGDKVVTLQSLNPIYVDFFVPQQRLRDLEVGEGVILNVDAYPGQPFLGKITTIEPKVDPDTRNVKVEATLENPEHKLLPGMFGQVVVSAGKVQRLLTLPQTAVSFNPYGEMVYFITESKEKDKYGKPKLIANQVFVKTGEKRGDQIVILEGIKEGDKVVTSGQLKLRNGSQVVINNAVHPSNNPDPRVVNE